MPQWSYGRIRSDDAEKWVPRETSMPAQWLALLVMAGGAAEGWWYYDSTQKSNLMKAAYLDHGAVITPKGEAYVKKYKPEVNLKHWFAENTMARYDNKKYKFDPVDLFLLLGQEHKNEKVR